MDTNIVVVVGVLPRNDSSTGIGDAGSVYILDMGGYPEMTPTAAPTVMVSTPESTIPTTAPTAVMASTSSQAPSLFLPFLHEALKLRTLLHL
jgi:hypothetical protein